MRGCERNKKLIITAAIEMRISKLRPAMSEASNLPISADDNAVDDKRKNLR